MTARITAPATRLAAAALLALALSACASSDSGDDQAAGHGEHGPRAHADTFAEGKHDASMKLGLMSYAFTGLQSRMTGPNVLIEAENGTTTPHEVVIVDESGREVAEIEEFTKGSRSVRAVLKPGTYRLKCLVKEGARTHEDLGMVGTFVVS